MLNSQCRVSYVSDEDYLKQFPRLELTGCFHSKYAPIVGIFPRLWFGVAGYPLPPRPAKYPRPRPCKGLPRPFIVATSCCKQRANYVVKNGLKGVPYVPYG